jgi:fluoride exporter
VTGVWVALAGGIGALTRFAADGAIRSRWPGPFPWATLAVNVSGSMVLGVLTGVVLFHGGSDDLRLIAGTGFCGGYTTFSAAAFETVRLAQRRRWPMAVAYLAATVGLTLGAAAVGLLVLR